MRYSLLRLEPGQDADLHVVQALRAALADAPLLASAPVVHVTSPDRRGRELKHRVGAAYPGGSPERVARALLAEFAPALQFRGDVERDFDFFAALDDALRQLGSARRPGRALVDQLLEAHKRVAQTLPPDGRDLEALLAPLGERGRLPALVLRHYAAGLRREGRHDPEDALWLAAQAMPGWAPAFAPALVVIDELDRVTPARRAFLAALLHSAERGLVLLRGSAEEVPFEAAAHAQLQQLVLELDGRTAPTPELPSRPGASLLADWAAGRVPAAQTATLLRPATRAAEVRDAARIIKRAQAAGEELSGICVAFPAAGAYRELIEETFAEAGIPYDSPFETPLSGIAPVAALQDMVRAALGGLERMELLDALRSPFLAFGAQNRRALLEQAESDTREANITGGVDIARDWLQPLQQRGTGGSEAASWLGGILRLLQPLTRQRLRAGEFFRALLALARDSGAAKVVERGLHRHALHGLERLLGEMADNFARLGDPVLRTDELARALSEQLEARTLREPEIEANRVRVLGMKELRGARFAQLILLGLTDRDLPLPEPTCMFFPPAQEQALATTTGAAIARELCSPVDVAAQADYLFGAALTAARQLVLSFPAGEGDTPFVPAGPLARLLGGEGHEHLTGLADDAPISPGRLALELGRRLRAMELEPPEAGRGCSASTASPAVRAGLLGRIVELCRDDSVATPGEHDGVVGAWPLLARRFGPAATDAHVFSPSQLDAYATCPMRFWGRYVLGIRVPDEPTLDTPPNAVGTLLHRALERFVLLLRAHAGQPEVLQDPLQREAVSLLKLGGSAQGGRKLGLRLMAQALDEACADNSVRGPFWDGVRRMVAAGLPGQPEQGLGMGILARFVEHELERNEAGFSARFAELTFGSNEPASPAAPDTLPAVFALPVRGGVVRLRGSVDRVDEGPAGLEVVDFKTGKARTQAEIADGRAFQLAVYLAVVSSLTGMQPGGIGYLSLPAAKELKFTPGLKPDNKAGLTPEVLVQHLLPARLGRLLEALEQGVFLHLPFAREVACRGCEFAAACALRPTVAADRRAQLASRKLDVPAYLPEAAK